MKKTYYLFNPGVLSRNDNTLKFTPVDDQGNAGPPRYLPVEGVDELYVFGALDANSSLYNFLEETRFRFTFSIITKTTPDRLCHATSSCPENCWFTRYSIT
jgi:CRISP-associated protein Cas1